MDTELFHALGFRWDRDRTKNEPPVHSVERAVFRFHRMLADFVWDASVLEGNPFTYPEVKTLLDGVTVGGRRLSDQEQVLNLAESSRQLIGLVKKGEFSLEKRIACGLHAVVARKEALEWGHFRGEGLELNYTPAVGLGKHGQYIPPATVPHAPELNAIYAAGTSLLRAQVKSPFERGRALFLFGALQQFFFDGNKRTARFMMNGELMSAGIDAISVPAARAQEFNEAMVRFYLSKDATEMMSFLESCHPAFQPSDSEKSSANDAQAARPTQR